MDSWKAAALAGGLLLLVCVFTTARLLLRDQRSPATPESVDLQPRVPMSRQRPRLAADLVMRRSSAESAGDPEASDALEPGDTHQLSNDQGITPDEDTYPQFLSARLESEPADRREANALSYALSEILRAPSMQGTQLEGVACGSTVCRAVVVHDDGEAQDRFRNGLLTGGYVLIDERGCTATRIDVTADGQERYALFFPVSGQLLPPLE